MNRLKHDANTVLLAMSLLSVLVNNSVAERDHETARRLQEAGVIMPLETILKKQWRNDVGRILD